MLAAAPSNSIMTPGKKPFCWARAAGVRVKMLAWRPSEGHLFRYNRVRAAPAFELDYGPVPIHCRGSVMPLNYA